MASCMNLQTQIDGENGYAARRGGSDSLSYKDDALLLAAYNCLLLLTRCVAGKRLASPCVVAW